MRKILPKRAQLMPPDAKCVFKGVIYDVYQWEQEMFEGTKKTFEMLKRADTVKNQLCGRCVIGRNERNEFTLAPCR